MKLSQRMALNCTECGQSITGSDDYADERDIIAVSCLVRTPGPIVDASNCPKCGQVIYKEAKLRSVEPVVG